MLVNYFVNQLLAELEEFELLEGTLDADDEPAGDAGDYAGDEGGALDEAFADDDTGAAEGD